MTMTRERTVAEIIYGPPPARFSENTKLCASCGTPYDPPMTKRSPCCGDCWYPLDSWYDYAGHPTPDDMLAWIYEQGYAFGLGTTHKADGKEPFAWLSRHTMDSDYRRKFYGPSIVANMEQAVRAIVDAAS